MENKQISILGSQWTLIYANRKDDPILEEFDGYADHSIRTIVIMNPKDVQDGLTQADDDEVRRRVLRHEIVHAYLMESGLDNSSLNHEAWALNEEMVDWFAIQAPKIFRTFKEVGCM